MEVMVRKSESGQVVLILVLAATVVGTLVVSLASRSTVNLRTQTLDTERIKALKGAESGVEQAFLSQGSVPVTGLGDGVSYVADYLDEGGTGMVSDLVDPGDVVDVLIEGADSGVNGVKIYFSSGSSTAVKISEYRVVGGSYLVNSYAYDGDIWRVLANNFSIPGSGGTFKETVFESSKVISVSPTTSKLLRIMVLYSASKIGVKPVGGNLPDQQVVISSVGTYSVSADVDVKKRLELRKEMEKAPAVFDRVLYSNARLAQ